MDGFFNKQQAVLPTWHLFVTRWSDSRGHSHKTFFTCLWEFSHHLSSYWEMAWKQPSGGQHSGLNGLCFRHYFKLLAGAQTAVKENWLKIPYMSEADNEQKVIDKKQIASDVQSGPVLFDLYSHFVTPSIDLVLFYGVHYNTSSFPFPFRWNCAGSQGNMEQNRN